MKPIISPLAQSILIKKQNEYWLHMTHKAFLVDAVDFKEDAARLSGPFDEKYGLVFIYDRSEGAKPFDVMVQESYDRCFDGTTWMPCELKQKIEALVGQKQEHHFYSEFWFNEATKQSISDIDIRSGASREGFHDTGDKCTVFFNSPQGQAYIKSLMTPEELAQWTQKVEDTVNSWKMEMWQTSTCKEKPYLLHVQGTDDCSFSKTYASLDECLHMLQDLKQYGFHHLDTRMTFTN